MGKCYFCDAETDNLEEIDGGWVRVCEDCAANPPGGELLCQKLEQKKTQRVGKSFDPNANWLEELNQIKKEQETTALVDDEALLKITRELERLKNEEAAFKTQLQEMMERKGVKSLKTDYFMITYVGEHSQRRLDQKALEQAHPEIYAKFLKSSTVKASVKITLKKENKND